MSLHILFSARKQILVVVTFLFSLNISSQVLFNDLEGVSFSSNWIGLQTIDSGFAHSGKYFSRTDAENPYGLGIEQPFPDEVAGKNTYLTISGFVRSNTTDESAVYVLTIIDTLGQSRFWKGIYLSDHIKDWNSWHYFEQTFKIPSDQTIGTIIKAYLWNNNSQTITHLDDLKYQFSIINNPSFTPYIEKVSKTNTDYQMIYSNSWYAIFINSDKRIIITGEDNKPLINNIRYFTDRIIMNDTVGKFYDLTYKSAKLNNNVTELKFSASDIWGKLEVIFKCNDLSGTIRFQIHEKFTKSQDVYRESIVIEYNLPVKEVYKQNRKVDHQPLQTEYWLDKQGLLFSDSTNSMSLYHLSGISSLQLNNLHKKLFVNLDYEKDHPFFRFPLAPDSTDWRLDESFSTYKHDKREYHFGIDINPNVKTLPRFMKNPAGFEATYIWTEHADFTDIRTNRATYFGSENIKDADSAIGGFVYYNIPVTKSVFYDNPDSVTNEKASNGVFNELESTILTDTEFKDFLYQINSKGHDLCLHTPDHYTTTPQLLEESLDYMQKNFGSPSWIDHGNNNGPENNREDLICDATLKKSPLYGIDLWNEYGVKYLHNAYYEELNTFGNWQYDPSLEKPYSGFGDFFPKPDYYQHHTRTKNLYHWSTSSALFVSADYFWDYLFNKNKLNHMINNWYIEINHVYPAWVDPEKGMWTYNADSTIVAHPGFNMALSNMAAFRDEGRLNITTIAEHLDYRTAVDNVDYEILVDGRVKVTNLNNFKICDLGMVAKARAVTIDGLVPSYKTIVDDIVFWFDLDVGESKLIRVLR